MLGRKRASRGSDLLQATPFPGLQFPQLKWEGVLDSTGPFLI